jgi:hypothetical protein
MWSIEEDPDGVSHSTRRVVRVVCVWIRVSSSMPVRSEHP